MPSTDAPPRSRPLRHLSAAREDATDEALVTLAMAGDAQALDLLLHRYRAFVRSRARAYFVIGGDHEDVVQEGMVGLYKAIRDFDPSHQTSFRGFAELCVVRQIITAVKSATRHKHGPLNSYVSLHAPVAAELGEMVLGDQFGGGEDPAEAVLATGDLAAVRAFCEHVLSDLEAEVLQRYLDGQSYAQIAQGLERHVKSIDNAVQRIRRKLEQYLVLRQAA